MQIDSKNLLTGKRNGIVYQYRKNLGQRQRVIREEL